MFAVHSARVLVTLVAVLFCVGPSRADVPLWEVPAPDLLSSFGYRSVSLPDQNGDGYPELLVTGWNAYTLEGSPDRVYLFFGGPGADSAPDLIIDDYWGRNFGWGLAAVGDVDGDGGEDFVIGTPPPNTTTNYRPSGFEFYRGGAALDTIPEVVFERIDPTLGNVGLDASGGGDFNGDGYADFVLAVDDKYPTVGLSAAWVYFGGPALDEEPDLILNGVDPGDAFGLTVLLDADYNDDGYADVAVAASRVGAPDYWTEYGRVYIFFGGPVPDAVADLVLVGEHFASRLGEQMASGDFDGDGKDDLVVVEGGYDTSEGDNVGRIVGFAGGTGFDAVPDAKTVGRYGVYRLSGEIALVNDAPGPAESIYMGAGGGLMRFDFSSGDVAFPNHFIPSPDDSPYSRFGFEVSDAGDVDGDGLSDVIVTDIRTDITRVYGVPAFDCNGNGVQDAQDIAGGLLTDCNGNGFPDECELNFWPGLDCDGDGTLDDCQIEEDDCDDNGRLDRCEMAQYYWLDCDNNGVLDHCEPMGLEVDCNQNGLADCREAYLDPALDCDRNGALDSCQVLDPQYDCDGDGTVDSCQTAWDSAIDCDGNGQPDSCQLGDLAYDCDLNGALDACEISADAALDCNLDGSLDLCQLTNAVLNRDSDDRLDSCELAEHPEWDCEGDGVLDNIAIQASPLSDCDANGIVDACEAGSPATPCREHPYLGIYFDAGLTQTESTIEALPLVGTLYVAVRGLDPDWVSQVDRYEIGLHIPAGIILLGGTHHPATGLDISPLNHDWWVITNGSFVPDPSGDLLLLTLPFAKNTTELGPNSRIRGGASLSTSASADGPVLLDPVSGLQRIVDVRSAWIGRTFEDCNRNDIDDLLDVASGAVTDNNGNLVPDECEVTAIPIAPSALRLLPPMPNPFNPRTTIRFEVPDSGPVELVVHDVAGRRVRTLVAQHLEAGPHQRVWEGVDEAGAPVASGVYYLRLVGGGEVRMGRLVLLR